MRWIPLLGVFLFLGCSDSFTQRQVDAANTEDLEAQLFERINVDGGQYRLQGFDADGEKIESLGRLDDDELKDVVTIKIFFERGPACTKKIVEPENIKILLIE